jgi:hypothetical protein
VSEYLDIKARMEKYIGRQWIENGRKYEVVDVLAAGRIKHYVVQSINLKNIKMIDKCDGYTYKEFWVSEAVEARIRPYEN